MVVGRIGVCSSSFSASDHSIQHCSCTVREASSSLNPRVAGRSGRGTMNVLLHVRTLLLPMISVFTVITVVHHHLLVRVITTVFLFIPIHLGIDWLTRSYLKQSRRMLIFHSKWQLGEAIRENMRKCTCRIIKVYSSWSRSFLYSSFC